MFPSFEPARLLRNPHLQTVWPSMWAGELPAYTATQHIVDLDDGDQVVLHDDLPEGWKNGDPITLMAHGLSGSYESPYLVRLSHKLNAIGFRAFRLDLRNCGAGFGLARWPYHGGRSEDILQSMEFIQELASESPISVAGFSLSGNIILRTLAENPHQLPEALVTGVAVNPPIDLQRSVKTLETPFGKMYDRYFTKRLVKHLTLVSEKRGDFPDPLFEKTPSSLYELDNLYTAPESGFNSADHYYAEASSKPILKNINLPTLILTAEDDPLIPVEMFAGLESHPELKLHIAPHGGHLGYRGRRGLDPDRQWMDWRVVEWLDLHGREHRVKKQTSSLEKCSPNFEAANSYEQN